MADTSAVDAFLKELVVSKQFELLETKNWDAISRLFPGVTPYQVCTALRQLSRNLLADL